MTFRPKDVFMEKTKFEMEFGIDLSSPNLDVIKGIDAGIKIEENGIEFYSEQAQKATHEAMRIFFGFMANQEKEHVTLLNELKKSLAEKKEWIDLEYEHPNKPDEFFRKGEEPELNAMLAAMETEKESANFYTRFAHAVGDEKGRSFFMKLAEWEQIHYNILNAIVGQSAGCVTKG